MHLHSYLQNSLTEVHLDYNGVKGVQNMETLFKETYAAMRKHNIVKGVVSGPLESVDYWKSNDPDGRIIRGLYVKHPADLNMNMIQFEELIKSGKVEVFGELVY